MSFPQPGPFVGDTDLLAANVPPPGFPTSLLLLSDAETTARGIGPVTRSFGSGDTSSVSFSLNRNATAQDLATLYCGSYAVVAGLNIVAIGSLTTQVVVSAGHALINGLVELAEDTSVPLPGDAPAYYVWFKQNGTFQVETSPATVVNDAVYLGFCACYLGVVSGVDYAGVVTLRGGVLWRKTGDAGPPTDAPTPLVFTTTVTGLYHWDGSVHWPISGAIDSAVTINVGNANYVLSQGQYRAQKLIFVGALTANRTVTVPNLYGAEWKIINQTTGGFSLIFRGSTGGGASIPGGTRATVGSDGTDVLTLSPPVDSTGTVACVTPETVVGTPWGFKLAGRLQPGDAVWAITREGDRAVEHVEHVSTHTQPLLKVQTCYEHDLRNLRCSRSHEVICYSGVTGRLEKRVASTLVPGDYLVREDGCPETVRVVQEYPDEQTVVLIKLAGPHHTYLTDGLWSHNKGDVV